MGSVNIDRPGRQASIVHSWSLKTIWLKKWNSWLGAHQPAEKCPSVLILVITTIYIEVLLFPAATPIKPDKIANSLTIWYVTHFGLEHLQLSCTKWQMNFYLKWEQTTVLLILAQKIWYKVHEKKVTVCGKKKQICREPAKHSPCTFLYSKGQ